MDKNTTMQGGKGEVLANQVTDKTNGLYRAHTSVFRTIRPSFTCGGVSVL